MKTQLWCCKEYIEQLLPDSGEVVFADIKLSVKEIFIKKGCSIYLNHVQYVPGIKECRTIPSRSREVTRDIIVKTILEAQGWLFMATNIQDYYYCVFSTDVTQL